ncbi:hypothetical protein DNTS_007756 [Danionella cerebrum]|nr:hypothetical protein DNTS_007756 [Danionella translucida]
MKKIVLVLLQAFLQSICCTSLRFIKPNVVSLEVSTLSLSAEVSLQCGEQYESEQIHWQRNGMIIPETGNGISIAVEGLRGGNFTCHNANGDFLNYTLLLVHPITLPNAVLLAQSTDKDFISCTARNYSGHFHCSWKWDPRRTQRAVVHFSAVRKQSPINCNLDSDSNGLSCSDADFCPYSEEALSIKLRVLVRNIFRLEEHQLSFFLQDIVRPDKVKVMKKEENVFEWLPPETWSFPCSFFPLAYQIKVLPKNSDCDRTGNRVKQIETNETQYEVNVQKPYTLCVRAQDPLTKNAWSDWSRHHQ